MLMPQEVEELATLYLMLLPRFALFWLECSFTSFLFFVAYFWLAFVVVVVVVVFVLFFYKKINLESQSKS